MRIFFINGISSVGFACHPLACQIQRYSHLNLIGINCSNSFSGGKRGGNIPSKIFSVSGEIACSIRNQLAAAILHKTHRDTPDRLNINLDKVISLPNEGCHCGQSGHGR